MEPKIKSIIRPLLIKYPSFGRYIYNTEFIENDIIETASTNGQVIYYNGNFLDSLNNKQKMFLFAHEISHIVLEHMYRCKGKNIQVWNIAADAIINDFLVKDGLEIIEGGILIDGASEYNTEELYDILLSMQQGLTNNNEQKNEQGESQDKSIKTQKSNSNHPKELKESEINKAFSENKEISSHSMWKEAADKPYQSHTTKEIDDREVFEQNNEERKKKLEQLKRDLAKKCSEISTSKTRELGKIDDAEDPLDWKDILRSGFVKGKYDYRLSKRVKNGVIPYELKKEETIPSTEILIDISGSVRTYLVREFLKQIRPLARKTQLKVGCFNKKFWGFKTIRTKEEIENFEIPYEWMSNNNCETEDWDLAVRSFSKGREVNRVVFTDGYPGPGHYPEDDLKGTNVTWIVYGNRDFKPCCGKVIQVDLDKINRSSKYDGWDEI